MSFRWVYTQPEQKERVPVLEQALGVPEIIARLLAIRGIKNYDDAFTAESKFCKSTGSHSEPPLFT